MTKPAIVFPHSIAPIYARFAVKEEEDSIRQLFLLAALVSNVDISREPQSGEESINHDA